MLYNMTKTVHSRATCQNRVLAGQAQHLYAHRAVMKRRNYDLTICGHNDLIVHDCDVIITAPITANFIIYCIKNKCGECFVCS